MWGVKFKTPDGKNDVGMMARVNKNGKDILAMALFDKKTGKFPNVCAWETQTQAQEFIDTNAKAPPPTNEFFDGTAFLAEAVELKATELI